MLNTTDLLEPATEKPRDGRAWIVRFWDDPDARSVTVGILGVLIVHLLLLLLGPRLLRIQGASPSAAGRHPAQPERFTVHLAPDLRPKPAPPKPALPKHFVETNPNAPDNIPDNANNFGARNQQAAQEKAQPNAHGNRPQIDGRTDVHSTQVVSGKLEQPAPAIAPPAQQPRKTATPPRRAQNPLTGFEKLTGNDPDGFGSAVAPKLENPTAVQNPVTGVQDSPLFDGADQNQPPIDPQHPRARPVLQHIRARPAIFEENRFGTPNIGVVANDSRFNNYGAYLERMSEAVQAEWDEILSETTIDIPVSTVTIQFRINSNGEITEIIRTDSTSSSQGAESCKTALTARSPFGKWSDDMVAALGTSQVMTYTFYYEQP